MCIYATGYMSYPVRQKESQSVHYVVTTHLCRGRRCSCLSRDPGRVCEGGRVTSYVRRVNVLLQHAYRQHNVERNLSKIPQCHFYLVFDNTRDDDGGSDERGCLESLQAV